MKSSRIFALAALLLVGPHVVDADSAEPAYAFYALDVPAELGGFTSAYGINNAGLIVGNFVTLAGDVDGFMFNKGKFTHVTVPGASADNRGGINDVNDLGQAVGSFADAETGVEHSFVRSKSSQITVLPDAAPGAWLTEATGINNAGVIVGFFIDADGELHGFILSKGTNAAYDHPGATRTLLTRINDRGQIVGTWVDGDGHRHGFLLQDGAAISIDVPGALSTRCTGINNWGANVGWYVDENFVAHGFLLQDGRFTDIDFPGAEDTAALGINDHGVIVGTYDGFSRGMVAMPNE